jgi:hypothetical protein
MSAKKRVPIPAKIEGEVMFASNRICCVDQKNQGVHIHHIDGDPSNNDFMNLALLCFDCHDEATKTGSFKKKLSPQAIINFRTHHYKVIQQRRNNELVQITSKTANPTYIDHLNIAIQANVLIEIAKIKSEYYASAELNKYHILTKFYVFKNYCFPRVSAELFEFLIEVSYQVRAEMPLIMLEAVVSLVEDYFPPEGEKITKLQIEKIGKLALQIAYGIIYDTSIHTSRFHSMKKGYELLQFIYRVAENKKNANLKKEVKTILSEIRLNLNRPERNDLGLAKLMLETYYQQIMENCFMRANLSDELESVIWSEKIK